VFANDFINQTQSQPQQPQKRKQQGHHMQQTRKRWASETEHTSSRETADGNQANASLSQMPVVDTVAGSSERIESQGGIGLAGRENGDSNSQWGQAQFGYDRFDSFDPDLLNALSYADNQHPMSDDWDFAEQ
jgi:hypothetical protein